MNFDQREYLSCLGFDPVSFSTAQTAPKTADPSAAEARSRVESCTLCHLSQCRKRPIYGEGAIPTQLLFVGEAPEELEDKLGQPFAGAPGELLTKMLTAMGLSREKVFLTYLAKCRPPADRPATDLERTTCSEHLLGQMALLRPNVIVALGPKVAAFLTGLDLSLEDLRGTLRPLAQALDESLLKLKGDSHRIGELGVMSTFAPGFLIHNAEFKRQAWDDLQVVMRALK